MSVSFAEEPIIFGETKAEKNEPSVAEMVANVVGGKPEDYMEICETLAGFRIDDIIEAVIANLDSF